MKILAYGHSALATPFGTPSATRDWCEALAKAGAEVTLVADAGTRVVAPPTGVRCVRLPHRFSKVWGGRLRWPKGLARLIGESDVVVIHGAWRPSNVIMASIARRIAVPYIATPHGLYDPHIVARHRVLRRGWWMLAEGRYVERAAAVHLFFRDEPHAFPFPARLIVAPNGLTPPQNLRWDGGSSGRVVWLGRFDVQHKGLDLLIEAIESRPCVTRPEVRLIGHDWFSQNALLAGASSNADLPSWNPDRGAGRGRREVESTVDRPCVRVPLSVGSVRIGGSGSGLHRGADDRYAVPAGSLLGEPGSRVRGRGAAWRRSRTPSRPRRPRDSTPGSALA